MAQIVVMIINALHRLTLVGKRSGMLASQNIQIADESLQHELDQVLEDLPRRDRQRRPESDRRQVVVSLSPQAQDGAVYCVSRAAESLIAQIPPRKAAPCVATWYSNQAGMHA